jgi:glycosyltransferase involved in cell wall biosynthesis
VATFHDLFVMTNEYSSPDFRARFIDQARRAAANSDLVIAVSQFTADQVNTLLDVPSARIRVVPHGVRSRENPSSASREKMVLFVGALQIRKNLIRLLEAFERMPDEWTLTLAGASGFGAGEILQRIEKSAARPRVAVVGYVPSEEVEALYARASIFAFPSLDEGFGMPVLEAMAHGVPVVTSNRSALPQVAGDAALLVDPCRTEEIAAALLRLAADGQRREFLVQAGLARAKLFRWDTAVESTYAVYKELTD